MPQPHSQQQDLEEALEHQQAQVLLEALEEQEPLTTLLEALEANNNNSSKVSHRQELVQVIMLCTRV